ncbi:MAG: SMP-30/gluconolactonase/LRE family protein [Alphaproteobacteria bacterium]
MTTFTEVTAGLRFPEGPIALPDGDVLVVEIARGTLSRVKPDGTIEVVAETGGGPNGAAIGPDGACYVCNNGGYPFHERDGRLYPDLHEGSAGRIERVDLATGRVDVLYTACDGEPLRAPNDLVFDDRGGFWFTDHGHRRRRSKDRTGVYYAAADGDFIREAIFPVDEPNGVGLSPDGKTLYVAETYSGRVFAYDIVGRGEVDRKQRALPWMVGRLLFGSSNLQMFDSLAVEANGNICVATIGPGGITVIAPDGVLVEHVALPDVITTNICFGGPDLRTAYITLSSTGRLVRMDWPRPGLALHYPN